MRAPSRALRKRRQDLLGMALIVGSLLVAAALGALYWLSSPQAAIDSTTMCPEAGPEGLTVLLIDATDPITPIQRASLHNYFENLVATTPVRSAVGMFTVDQVGEHVLHPIGERICNPGRGASALTQNPAQIEARWRERFWQPLQQWEEQAVARTAARSSPIFESLQSIAVTEFQRRELAGKQKTLVVVSDLLHHTDRWSQYAGIESFDTFRQTDYYKTVRTTWSDVAVELLYLTRPRTPQGTQHLDFWRQYFADAGGVVARVTTF